MLKDDCKKTVFACLRGEELPSDKGPLVLDGDVHGGPAEKGKEIVECQLPALPAPPGPGGPLPTAAVFWFFKTGLGS